MGIATDDLPLFVEKVICLVGSTNKNNGISNNEFAKNGKVAPSSSLVRDAAPVGKALNRTHPPATFPAIDSFRPCWLIGDSQIKGVQYDSRGCVGTCLRGKGFVELAGAVKLVHTVPSTVRFIALVFGTVDVRNNRAISNVLLSIRSIVAYFRNVLGYQKQIFICTVPLFEARDLNCAILCEIRENQSLKNVFPIDLLKHLSLHNYSSFFAADKYHLNHSGTIELCKLLASRSFYVNNFFRNLRDSGRLAQVFPY
uniref:Uncharacterized protein n=1 Tax=Romanomermis culicivorax TaxID=13658 RepID=A0A915L9Q0_ROMCU